MALSENLNKIIETLKATQRKSGATQKVTIVAATKTQPFSIIEKTYSLGVHHIGENRIQEAAAKFKSFENMPKITKRFIGHLQTNKVNKFFDMFDTIDSIDSFKLANKINNKAKDANKSIPALLEINTSGDENKKGFKPKVCDQIIRCLNLDNLNVSGLMTLGPLTRDIQRTRKAFVDLRKFSDSLNKELGSEALIDLSMGMSGDYTIGVEEGSTMIRVGTSLFGARL